MYLCSDLVKNAFLRLRPRFNKGKTHLERTSAVMIFLAFSALAKKRGASSLDFPPKSYLRPLLAGEFRRLVELEHHAQVVALGSVEYSPKKDPEARLGSNFLTSLLKKASVAAVAMDYPNRPKPLLRIGKIDDESVWGIEQHADWKANLPAFFSETESNTPFTDLAIFILRYEFFDSDSGEDIRTSIFEKLSEVFPSDVADFFKAMMSAERPFAKHLVAPIFDEARENLAKAFMESPMVSRSREDELRTWSKNLLVQRIVSLEKVLSDLGVDYEKL